MTEDMTTNNPSPLRDDKKKSYVPIAIIYLLGIFMGAIDTGIVTPARTIIQTDFMVDEKLGVWMFTIYTLAFAASIPIMGKLADRLGRKPIYILSITLFGVGSLFCGLSQNFDSFTLFLIARAVQAIGAGGIMPIATAEFGTTFPEEKRGLALGLIGSVYGIANILGASAGSFVLDIFGKNNWEFIFFINIPITVIIIIFGLIILPNHKMKEVQPIDLTGIFVLTAMILSLLYGLKNIDFFNFTETIVKTNVYPFLIAFIMLIPIFIFIEKRAKDPVINLHYFTNKNIVITLMMAFITGIVLMGLIFVPQFAENALRVPTGSGGYYVMILGFFSAVSAILSGKLTDKIGPKRVLLMGFLISITGAMFLGFVAAHFLNFPTVAISLMLVGFGLGFTIGVPINYMMLGATHEKEANSALANVSLMRSIGTVIAPAIMIGFLANAGASVQGDLLKLLPNEIHMPQLPYAAELNAEFAALRVDPVTGPMFKDVPEVDFESYSTVTFDPTATSGMKLPEEVTQALTSSDVTNITKNTQLMATAMFDQMAPSIIKKAQDNLNMGINNLNTAIENMPPGLPQRQALSDTVYKMETFRDAIPGAFDEGKANYLDTIEKKGPKLEDAFQNDLNKGFKQIYLTVTFACLIGLIGLFFYRENK